MTSEHDPCAVIRRIASRSPALTRSRQEGGLFAHMRFEPSRRLRAPGLHRLNQCAREARFGWLRVRTHGEGPGRERARLAVDEWGNSAKEELLAKTATTPVEGGPATS